jgi:hypothetical protein
VGEWTRSTLLRRAAQRAEVDALVAASFGLELDDLTHVLADFPLLDRHQPGTGWGRATITRDLLLLEHARRGGERTIDLRDLRLPADGGPFDLAERVVAAVEVGQIGFVPGELAKAIWPRG